MWEVIILQMVLTFSASGTGEEGAIVFTEKGWKSKQVCEKRLDWLLEWGGSEAYLPAPLFKRSSKIRGICIYVEENTDNGHG